ncbi:MAG: hypothetical protein GC159_02705 [Phycisphaera sp.]|nr:hypothetical protein [Phycisphaera sp.]
MTYQHTQRAPMYLLLLTAGVALLLGAILSWPHPACYGMAGGGAVVTLLAFAFCHLRVRDIGDALAVGFGPLPLFRKRVPYDAVTGVRTDRSSVLDGWGIHYRPGLGWIWNLWGRDCVRIEMGDRTLRIGTDEPEALCAFLRERSGSGDSSVDAVDAGASVAVDG